MVVQEHAPGAMAQSDFTPMSALGITLGGLPVPSLPFPHLLVHLVLTYSNVEAVSICFAESFEALAAGRERGLWQSGGGPRRQRTAHLGAAVRPLETLERQEFRARYRALVAHDGLEPSMNNAGEAHENGDVEQAHYRFKEAVDQALPARAGQPGFRGSQGRRALPARSGPPAQPHTHGRRASPLNGRR